MALLHFKRKLAAFLCVGNKNKIFFWINPKALNFSKTVIINVMLKKKVTVKRTFKS